MPAAYRPRTLAAAVLMLAVASLTACGDGDHDSGDHSGSAARTEASSIGKAPEPDHVALLTADTFGDLCAGPIRDSLVAIAPDVWASASDDPAEEIAVNAGEEGDVSCVWDGPDGTALYAEYKSLAAVSDELLAEPGASSDKDLAAAAGTTEAYLLNKDEYGSYGAAWVSGDNVFLVSTDTDESVARLSADDLATIVQSLPAAAAETDSTGETDEGEAAPEGEESNDMLLELTGDCVDESDVSAAVGFEVSGGVGAEGDNSRTCSYSNYDETSDGYTRGDALIYLYGPDLVPWPEGGDPPATFRMTSSLYGDGVRTTDPDRMTFTFDDPSYGCAQAAPSPTGGTALVEVRTMSDTDPLPADPCAAAATLLEQALTLSPVE